MLRDIRTYLDSNICFDNSGNGVYNKGAGNNSVQYVPLRVRPVCLLTHTFSYRLEENVSTMLTWSLNTSNTSNKSNACLS